MTTLYFARNKETGQIQDLSMQHRGYVEEFIKMTNDFCGSEVFELVEIPEADFEARRSALKNA
ncbi:hypothetical protein AAB988_29495 [Burkholderia contaminans]|uniref:hypothetical protein n=1 Tax=Burkholderia contaminans TaxID=488447 RepID=UPI00310F9764